MIFSNSKCVTSFALFAFMSSIVNAVPIVTSGFLADNLCISIVNAPDGANMKTGPEAHSVGCLLLPQCKASNYSIITNTASKGATPNYAASYSIHGDDTPLVLQYINTLPSNGNKVYVNINGDLNESSKILRISSASALKSQSFEPSLNNADTVTVSGYLADNLCLQLPNKIAVDGANMITGPEKHSVGCLLLDACIKSNFSIITNTAANGALVAAYDTKYIIHGDYTPQIVSYINTLKTNGVKDNVWVTVTGNVISGTTISLLSIKSAMPTATPTTSPPTTTPTTATPTTGVAIMNVPSLFVCYIMMMILAVANKSQ